jgi:redox-sensitive bicupin YhaK (pirin superfamily)
MVGSIADATSEAGVDHPTVGLDVTFRERVEIAADQTFEHAVVPIGDRLKVDDAIVEPGSLAYVPPGYARLAIETRSGTSRFLLLGGEPLGVPIKMWWNFVARDLDEITDAWRAWRDHDDDRFGPVPSSLARIDAPTPPWLAGA